MKIPKVYQDEDARRLATDPTTHGLAGKPGTGKTFTSLLACTYLSTVPHVLLIVCPAVAIDVWLDELEDFGRWTGVALRDAMNRKRYTWPQDADPVAYVVSYEHIVASSKVRDFIDTIAPGFTMLCDEGHYLKNPAAKRTQHVYGTYAERAARVWPLSGTFMLNHPGELWPHLDALASERIDGMNYWRFTRTYCKIEQKDVPTKRVRGRVTQRRTIEVISGSNREKLPELRARVKGLFVPREVPADLPPLNFVTRPVHRSQCDLSLLKEMEDDPELQHEVRAVEAALRSQDPAAALEKVNAAKLRRMMGLVKAPAVVSWTRDIVENTKSKVLVWGYHKAALDIYLEGLAEYGAVMLRGDTSPPARKKAIDRLNNDPSCRIFIGQIQAAGTAITLNAADREVFGEEIWTPSYNFQAAKRCHRMGQDKSVLVETLFLRGSTDELVAKVLNRKTRDINALEGAI